MKILNLVQGTDEWLVARLEHFTASEAPVMMGDSSHMTRNQLLDLKKGWKANPNSAFKEKLFQKGHEHEAMARPITEMELLEDLDAKVGSIEIDGIELLASFDGITEVFDIVWEHKDWNLVLAENVRNGVLEPMYYWQLEQQLLVSGAEYCQFTVSDGTTENRISMDYYSVPERREALIAGWKQFAIDLENHQLEAKKEKVVSNVQGEIALPMISYQVKGTEITSNLETVLDVFKDKMALESSVVLESEQDFIDKEARIKQFKKLREQLKEKSKEVKGTFASVEKFESLIAEFDNVLKTEIKNGESLVKSHKDKKKAKIVSEAKLKLADYIHETNKDLAPYTLPLVEADFEAAIKNKRTIPSIQSAADTELAQLKIQISEYAQRMSRNISLFKSKADGYGALFVDIQQHLMLEEVAFLAVVDGRIAQHKQEEAEREAKLKADADRQAQEEANKRAAEAKAPEPKAETVEVAQTKVATKQPTLVPDTEPGQNKPVTSGVSFNFSDSTKSTLSATPKELALSDVISDWADEHDITEEAAMELVELLQSFGIDAFAIKRAA